MLLPECQRKNERGLIKIVENLADYKEIVDVIKASGGEAFKLCYQCGLCDAVFCSIEIAGDKPSM